MPKTMRLIDAEALAGVLEEYRDTYSRKQDGRAVRMLDWVLSLIDEAPTLTVHVEASTKRTGKKAEPKHKYGKYKEEERAAEGKPESSFDTDEFAALAMARSYGGKS